MHPSCKFSTCTVEAPLPQPLRTQFPVKKITFFLAWNRDNDPRVRVEEVNKINGCLFSPALFLK